MTMCHYQKTLTISENRSYARLSELAKKDEDGYGCTVCCITKAANNPLGKDNIRVSICNILNDDYVFYKLLDILFLL